MYIDMYEYYKDTRDRFKHYIYNIQVELDHLLDLSQILDIQLFHSGIQIWNTVLYAEEHINHIQEWYCSKI
ncbi:hypothetical protein LCGC14_1822510 [marine sediment metagenome]|uniref:Uncharacterized protein n=1 Tax=marine sediment metagenome TaxID=412755 RepID=A0A0F9IY71_9ZZZZ